MNDLQGAYVGQKVLVEKNYGGDWYNIFLFGKLVGKVEKNDRYGSPLWQATANTKNRAGLTTKTLLQKSRKAAVEELVGILEYRAAWGF